MNTQENRLPVRHRAHIFRAPELWSTEGDHLVRTQPSGKRDALPLNTLREVHLWRNTPSHCRTVTLGSFLWANFRFGTTWQRLSGMYPRGIHGIENQDIQVKHLVLDLITLRQDDPELRIHIGSRLEGNVGRIQIAILLLLPPALLFGLTAWITGSREHAGSTLPLWGVMAVISVLTSALVWLLLRREIKKRIDNGCLKHLTAKAFLAQPWEGLDAR